MTMNQLDRNSIEKLKLLPIYCLTPEDLSIEEVYDDAYSRMGRNPQEYEDECLHLLDNAPLAFTAKNIFHLIQYEELEAYNVPSDFLEDEKIANLYISKNYKNLEFLPLHYRDNEDFMMMACNQDGRALEYATDRLKHNTSISLVALENTPAAFPFIPEKLKTRKICLLALSGQPAHASNINFIPSELLFDLSFIKEVAVICSHAYQFLPSSLKEQEEISYAFISQYGANLQFAPEKFKNDVNLVSPLIEKVFHRFAYVGETLKNNVDFILPIIKKNPILIHDCGQTIKDNIDVAKIICNIRSFHPPIEFFNESIRSNPEVAMISLLRMPETMGSISKTLRDDENFVSSYIQHPEFNVIALHYISDNLKNNLRLMKQAYQVDPSSLSYVGHKLKYNEEFLEFIFSEPTTNVLFMNLKELQLKVGDESILLRFCNQLKAKNTDIHYPLVKAEILRQIKDVTLSNILREQDDYYAYLNSVCLHQQFQQTLPVTIPPVQKPKI